MAWNRLFAKHPQAPGQPTTNSGIRRGTNTKGPHETRHAAAVSKPPPPQGKTFNFGNDAAIAAAIQTKVKQPVSFLYFSLTIQGPDCSDMSYVDGIQKNLHAEFVKAFNATLALGPTEAIREPLDGANINLFPSKTCKHKVCFPIRVRCTDATKLAWLLEYINLHEAGVLAIHGLPGVKFAPAVTCKSRCTNPSMLLAFITDMDLTPCAANALLHKAAPHLNIEWIALHDGLELINGHGPTGAVDVSIGSSTPITHPDVSLVALVNADSRSHYFIKEGSADNGGLTFYHEALKSPTNKSGRVQMTILTRPHLVERDTTPLTMEQKDAALACIELTLATALLTKGQEECKTVPVPSDSEMESDHNDHKDYDRMCKASELATTISQLGKELLADAAILSSVSSPALSSTSVKLVQAAQAVIAPLAQSFEATSLETKVDEVKTLFRDRYDADVLVGQDDAAYSSADRAYFSLMRGLRYLLTHLHKTVKDHADIGDDVTLHLHKVKMAREDVERDDRNKQAKPLWGASPSASNKAL